MESEPTVFVVDDNPAVSHAIVGLTKLLKLRVEAYSSAEAFLEAYEPSLHGCLVLDIKMPGMTGLELQELLLACQIQLPVILISGHATVATAVAAMRRGAIILLEKPFDMEDLIRYIQEAIKLDAKLRKSTSRKIAAQDRIELLTAKEREVFELIAGGLSNKQIAHQLKLSLRAVEDRRARMMKKLRIHSAAELGVLACKVLSDSVIL